jgi:hypothetical protein
MTLFSFSANRDEMPWGDPFGHARPHEMAAVILHARPRIPPIPDPAMPAIALAAYGNSAHANDTTRTTGVDLNARSSS